MYYDPYHYRQIMDDDFIQGLTKAINGEYSAIICYEKLAQLAPNEEERNRILEIREDEICHFQTFCHIFAHLTGQSFAPQLTETCPNQYRAGLDFAFKDEQETVDFYLELSDKAHEPALKETLKRIASDEQNHAVWFLYYLTKQRPFLDP